MPAELGIPRDFYKTRDVHVHFPEGAVPKDGPSAGIAIATAMLSALTGRAVRHDVAMTGEVTLRGQVLPIGGLREKTMAAKRSGIKTVIIPQAGNEKDLADIDPTVREALRFIPAETVDAVFAHVLALPKKAAAVEHLTALTPAPMQEVRHGDQSLTKRDFVLSAVKAPAFIRDGRAQVTFAGRSNVGKSSVINRLLNRKNFARGATPGKTSQINLFPHRRQNLLHRSPRLRLCQGLQGGA